ncbi:hypothetical protein GA0115246_114812 [Streptomyces sp. SolWspMP-sol7th]|uniref:hypothetical protein n=1 Tax=Streptomyces sp. SolWspMP-sol7th TaxID=1839776 RepID=UPI00081E401B|nr:hypothetical protein [Streptomyces sp. SolWspMP-sol7th]SCE34062.1 hypothetical protein GA0115246_114812 [Streptomyces sp. SolWspMP-sol7th]
MRARSSSANRARQWGSSSSASASRSHRSPPGSAPGSVQRPASVCCGTPSSRNAAHGVTRTSIPAPAPRCSPTAGSVVSPPISETSVVVSCPGPLTRTGAPKPSTSVTAPTGTSRRGRAAVSR